MKMKSGYQVRILVQEFSYNPKVGSSERLIVDPNVATLHGDWSLGDWKTKEEADAAVASMVHVDGDACGGGCAK